jgi:hypothetical protein
MLNDLPPKNKAKIIYQNNMAASQLGISFQNVKDTLREYSA